MDSLIASITTLWNGINTTTIFSNNDISFTIGNLLISMFMITICLNFLKIIIKGKGDKT